MFCWGMNWPSVLVGSSILSACFYFGSLPVFWFHSFFPAGTVHQGQSFVHHDPWHSQRLFCLYATCGNSTECDSVFIRSPPCCRHGKLMMLMDVECVTQTFHYHLSSLFQIHLGLIICVSLVLSWDAWKHHQCLMLLSLFGGWHFNRCSYIKGSEVLLTEAGAHRIKLIFKLGLTLPRAGVWTRWPPEGSSSPTFLDPLDDSWISLIDKARLSAPFNPIVFKGSWIGVSTGLILLPLCPWVKGNARH